MCLSGVGHHLPATLTREDGDPEKPAQESQGYLEVARARACVACCSKMSSWPLCVLWPTSGGNYRCYPVGVLQNTAGASGGARGGGTARGKRRGSLGLPWLECGFPITRKLFGPDSGITRCSLKPRGRDGNGGPETKGEGVEEASQAGRVVGWRLQVPCCPASEGSSPGKLPGYSGK